MITYLKDFQFEKVEGPAGGKGTSLMAPLFDIGLMPHVRLLKIVELAPGGSVGEHAHDGEAELYLMLEGSATVYDGGSAFAISAGDAHLCPSGSRHGIENTSGAPMRMLAIITTEQ